MENILEEKANPNYPHVGIVIAGNCPEPLQKKAREFSEKVANGKHYMDLELGFIRGYQSAIGKAWDFISRYFACTSSLDFQKEMEE